MGLVYGGLVAAVILLGLKTGLILGSSGLPASFLSLFSAGLGIGLYTLTALFTDHGPVLAHLIERYTFLGGLAMAVILIYLSIQQPGFTGFDQKKTISWRTYGVGLLPCPFCMLALVLWIIIMAPAAGITVSVLGRNTAILFGMLVLATGMGVRQIIRLTGYDPHRIFNRILFLLGSITLLFALTIPNIVKSMKTDFRPITVESPFHLALVAAGLTVIIFWGYLSQKKVIKEVRTSGDTSRFRISG
ncbi:DUF2162 domain-containing protein [Calderihabitans maritimus]|uniref:Putative transporter n=1 Tax=Calderihabitans maritimus TaxID=1246530 RepID=A0A1Z5HSJ0_9FIRM|nr:DUF2162 domain-containing protein [Calderihabitans maritimus]GAW92499.1 putative transporter [Calderihabitans maritimus]